MEWLDREIKALFRICNGWIRPDYIRMFSDTQSPADSAGLFLSLHRRGIALRCSPIDSLLTTQYSLQQKMRRQPQKCQKADNIGNRCEKHAACQRRVDAEAVQQQWDDRAGNCC